MNYLEKVSHINPTVTLKDEFKLSYIAGHLNLTVVEAYRLIEGNLTCAS